MPPTHNEILSQLNAVNDWLGDVFGEGIRLSELLSKSGLSESEVAQIKTEHLTDFIEAVVTLISTTTEKHDGERRNDVMVRYYGLIDGKSETMQAIGDSDSLQISRERIRQLINKRLQFYRNPKQKEKFMTGLVTEARKLLNN